LEGIFILRSFYYGAAEYEINWAYWAFIIASLVAGYFAWEMIVDLPKPETFIELGKYYFTNTGDYLKATGLSLLTGIALIFACVTGLVSAFSNYTDYSNLYRWCIIIVGALVGVVSFYFLYYGGYLLLVMAVIGLIGIVIFNSDSNSKRRK